MGCTYEIFRLVDFESTVEAEGLLRARVLNNVEHGPEPHFEVKDLDTFGKIEVGFMALDQFYAYEICLPQPWDVQSEEPCIRFISKPYKGPSKSYLCAPMKHRDRKSVV